MKLTKPITCPMCKEDPARPYDTDCMYCLLWRAAKAIELNQDTHLELIKNALPSVKIDLAIAKQQSASYTARQLNALIKSMEEAIEV